MREHAVSIRKKMIFFYIALLLIPILLVGMAAYNRYISSVQRDVEIYLKQALEQINVNVESSIREINKLTITPLYDEAIMDILRAHKKPERTGGLIPSSETSKMLMFMLSAGFDRPEVDEIVIYTMDRIAFSNLDRAYGYEYIPVPDTADMGDYLPSLGIYLQPPHEKPVQESNVTKVVVSVYRELRDPFGEGTIGWIRIDLNSKMFSSIIMPTQNVHLSQVYIASRNHTLFYPEAVGGDTLPFEPGERPSINGVKYRCFVRQSNLTGLSVYQLIAEKDLSSGATQLVRFTLLLALCVVSIAVVVAIVFSYRFTQPIRKLLEHMALVEGGNFETPVQVRRRDELGRLCEGFNHMVVTIGQLIVENYETRLLKQEADLMALQSQMNPHFLYNTLDMINMSALECGQYEISDIVANLGKILRYTINNNRSMVRLEDEIRFVSAYVGILQMRNGDKLQVKVTCPAELNDCYVPKLILQPLVENAFLHGLNSDCGSISVNVNDVKGSLVMAVLDDGVGMSEETLLKLREYIASGADEETERYGEKTRGYALRNIYRRLLLAYKIPATFTIESTLGKGSCFTLTIPPQPSQPGEELAK